MPFAVFPYRPGSVGAKTLSTALGCPVIKHENSRFKARQRTIINWGYSRTELPEHATSGALRVLNGPSSVAFVSNKRNFFRALADESFETFSVIPSTEDEEVARTWIAKGLTVVARTVLNGHSGEGIAILDKSVDFVSAPVYTKYVKKSKEFRIHVMNGFCIDYQQKVRDPTREPTDWKVRSHDNGFIFQRNGVMIPGPVSTELAKMVAGLGLDFGAVDIIWTERSDRYYVLEVNTAPGLQGTTVESYARGFERHFSGN